MNRSAEIHHQLPSKRERETRDTRIEHVGKGYAAQMRPHLFCRLRPSSSPINRLVPLRHANPSESLWRPTPQGAR